jgi:ribosomal protein S27AE
MTDPIHCPNCGKGNSIVEAYLDPYDKWRVGCGACGLTAGFYTREKNTRDNVVAHWNKRPHEEKKYD